MYLMLHTTSVKTSIISNKRDDQKVFKALSSLKENNDILVIPADKGRAVVVMNTRDYKTKA